MSEVNILFSCWGTIAMKRLTSNLFRSLVKRMDSEWVIKRSQSFFFFPLAIHLPTRLIPLYVPPFPLFFRYHFFCIPPSCLGSPSLNLSLSVTPSNLKTCHLEEIPKQVWSAHSGKFLFIRREHFTILISDLRRKQGPKYDTLTPFDGMMKWWHILQHEMPCCVKQKSHKNGIAMK